MPKFYDSFVTCRNMQRAKSVIAVAACTSVAPGTVEMASVEMLTGPLSGSVCSPPHTANFTRRALAPAHCIAPSKTRRCAANFAIFFVQMAKVMTLWHEHATSLAAVVLAAVVHIAFEQN